MSQTLTVNGISFAYPLPGDRNWGTNASLWAAAVTSGMLQKAGGVFTLTANADFGASFGLKAAYFQTRAANPAESGLGRLARTDTIAWRNEADTADLALAVNSSNILTFNGAAVGALQSVAGNSQILPALSGLGVLTATLVAGGITNAEINASAAIALTKLAATTASRAAVTDASGFLTVSAATAAEIAFISGLTSAVQTQLDARLQLAGGTMTGALTLSGAPTANNHAATKAYVDSAASGFVVHDAVRAATTSAGTLSSDFENGDTVDGVVLATGNRILIKNQAAPAANGIYVVAASGAPTRATDADTWDELVQAFVFVDEGTVNAATSWVSQTVAGGTLGVTAVTFGQFGAAASFSADGQGIELSGTTFSLELDGTSLSKSASGLRVAAGGVLDTHVGAAASIARSKIAVGTANRLVVNANGTGALADAAAITAARALISDANGIPTHSTVTSTELAFLVGVTSAVQTQLNAKLALAGGTMSGALNMGTNNITNGGSGAFSSLTVSGVAALGASSTVDGEEIATLDDLGSFDAISAVVTGAAANTIDITGIPAFDSYQVVCEFILDNASGTETILLTYNNDSGANYGWNFDGSQDVTASSIRLYSEGLSGLSLINGEFRVSNAATIRKSSYGTWARTQLNSSGIRGIQLGAGFWNNTSDQISRMTFSTGNDAQFQVGSRVAVIGVSF